MDLIEVLQQINQSSMDAYGLSDLAIGTVTKVDPLEVHGPPASGGAPPHGGGH